MFLFIISIIGLKRTKNDVLRNDYYCFDNPIQKEGRFLRGDEKRFIFEEIQDKLKLNLFGSRHGIVQTPFTDVNSWMGYDTSGEFVVAIQISDFHDHEIYFLEHDVNKRAPNSYKCSKGQFAIAIKKARSDQRDIIEYRLFD